jgi:hypothetical protein
MCMVWHADLINAPCLQLQESSDVVPLTFKLLGAHVGASDCGQGANLEPTSAPAFNLALWPASGGAVGTGTVTQWRRRLPQASVALEAGTRAAAAQCAPWQKRASGEKRQLPRRRRQWPGLPADSWPGPGYCTQGPPSPRPQRRVTVTGPCRRVCSDVRWPAA